MDEEEEEFLFIIILKYHIDKLQVKKRLTFIERLLAS